MILLLFLLFQPYTESLEVIGGSLTYHLLGQTSDAFSNKVSSDDRLIANPLFGVQYTIESKDYYDSIAVFSGDNSVGGEILGVKASEGIKIDNWYLGLVLGAYEQDSERFTDLGINPFQIAQTGTTGIVPIVGVEGNYKISLSDSMFMKINNVVTPILTNTTLSMGVSF